MSIAIRETGLFQRYMNPLETPVRERTTITARVRSNVTTCLYRKRNNSARSLSTLIAVEVKTDIPHKMNPVTINASSRYRWLVFRSIRAIMAEAKNGCEIRPAKRSVTARHRNRSFVGGWREVSFRRAKRIKAFPSDAVMESKMFKVEREISTSVSHVDASCWFISLVQFSPCKVKLAIFSCGRFLTPLCPKAEQKMSVSFRWVITNINIRVISRWVVFISCRTREQEWLCVKLFVILSDVDKEVPLFHINYWNNYGNNLNVKAYVARKL